MNKIRHCREINKMSQKFVALSVGVSAPMVSQWESGIKEPSKESIVKLADLFGVTTDYLLDHETSGKDLTLTAEERQLLLCFRQLNQDGKSLLLSAAETYLSRDPLRQEGSMSSEKNSEGVTV